MSNGTTSAGRPAFPHHWYRLAREAELARTCLSSGLYSLAKANHLETGLYTSAFFNLSIGIERVSKLAIIVHRWKRSGTVPTEKEMRGLGHSLDKLAADIALVRDELEDDGATPRWPIDLNDALTKSIITVLAEFAESSRYYNINYLVGARQLGRDPLKAWNAEVRSRIADRYPKKKLDIMVQRADEIQTVFGGAVGLLQHAESETRISGMSASIVHSTLGRWVQKQATFECAKVVRYFVETLEVVHSHDRATSVALQIPEFEDFFRIYLNPDRFLKDRKRFD
jgi:hypothetical protein